VVANAFLLALTTKFVKEGNKSTREKGAGKSVHGIKGHRAGIGIIQGFFSFRSDRQDAKALRICLTALHSILTVEIWRVLWTVTFSLRLCVLAVNLKKNAGRLFLVENGLK
jgi:hypothetical protein